MCDVGGKQNNRKLKIGNGCLAKEKLSRTTKGGDATNEVDRRFSSARKSESQKAQKMALIANFLHFYICNFIFAILLQHFFCNIFFCCFSIKFLSKWNRAHTACAGRIRPIVGLPALFFLIIIILCRVAPLCPVSPQYTL